MAAQPRLNPASWYAIAMAVGVALLLGAEKAPQPFAAILAVAAMGSALGFATIAWRGSDEAVREAHKVAWWHGGNVGLVAAITVCLLMPATPAIPALVSRVAALLPHLPAAPVGFALGVMFLGATQALLYTGVWVGWWIRRR